MTDEDLVATIIASEAGGEPEAGKAAIAQVFFNRMRLHYQSDGTPVGTGLHPGAFSELMFAMVNGKYTRVVPLEPTATLHDRMMDRAQTMEQHYARQAVWPQCWALAQAVVAGEPLMIEPALTDAVLYVNLEISHPVWVSKVRFLAKIGAHSFFADP